MSDGEKILQLLHLFGDSEQFADDIQTIYNTAFRQRNVSPREAVGHCQKGLILLDRSLSSAFEHPITFAYSRGILHLLIASIYIDRNTMEDWLQAVGHYQQSEEEFHLNAWAYLDSLAYLGLALSQQKLGNLAGAIDACHQADMLAYYESIPSTINIGPLRQAVTEVSLRLATRVEETGTSVPNLMWKILIVSAIAAGLEQPIAQEHIQGYVELEEREGKASDYFVVVVDGDSMAGDDINSGDKVLIRQQAEANNGDIAALVINVPDIKPVEVLKRYYLDDRPGTQHWFLKSSNFSAKDLVVVPAHINIANIRQIYDKEIRADSVVFYEQAELKIAGVYVEVVDQ